MGTLLDITSSANNIRQWSLDSSDVLSDSPSPRFMSPTIASRVAALGHTPKRSSTSTLTSTSVSLKKSTSSNWMSAAAKRIGVNHTKNEVPTSTGHKKFLSKSSRSLSSLKVSYIMLRV